MPAIRETKKSLDVEYVTDVATSQNALIVGTAVKSVLGITDEVVLVHASVVVPYVPPEAGAT